MNSMTGYGRGEATNGAVGVVVEIKTVNNRFRDLNVRLPREYAGLEPSIKSTLSKSITRGRVEVFVRRTTTDSIVHVTADTNLARSYFEACENVLKALGKEDTISLEMIIKQPGVLSTSEVTTDASTEWDVVSTALSGAMDQLLSMRSLEGTALKDDLTHHLDQLQRIWADITAAADGVAKRLKDKLQDKLNRMLSEHVDPIRLAQEAAILAHKADIAEELSRIRSHVKQFSDSLHDENPVGRKLEFLVQELNREVNTIGSKAAEHQISAQVVELKSVLERIREQAANVE